MAFFLACPHVSSSAELVWAHMFEGLQACIGAIVHVDLVSITAPQMGWGWG